MKSLEVCRREASRVAQEKGYQGYTNYETWSIAVWIDNIQEEYNYWQARVAELIEEAPTYEDGSPREVAAALAEDLQGAYEEGFPEIEGPYSVILHAGMVKVDWDQIAVRMLEDAE